MRVQTNCGCLLLGKKHRPRDIRFDPSVSQTVMLGLNLRNWAWKVLEMVLKWCLRMFLESQDGEPGT